MKIFLLTLGILLTASGLPGIFLPFLPGIPLAFAGYIVISAGIGFKTIPVFVYIALFLITLISVLADYFASSIATKRAGGSNISAIGAFAGLVVGIISGQFYLMFLLPFLFAFLIEYLRSGNLKRGLKVGTYAFAGFLGSIAFRVFAYFLMLAIFLYGILG